MGLQDGVALLLVVGCAYFIARKFLAPFLGIQTKGSCKSNCGCEDESPKSNEDTQA